MDRDEGTTTIWSLPKFRREAYCSAALARMQPIYSPFGDRHAVGAHKFVVVVLQLVNGTRSLYAHEFLAKVANHTGQAGS